MALQRVRSNMLANNFVLDDDQGLIVGSGNNIYIDTVNNRVGINTNSPTHDFTVSGNIHATGNITAGGDITLGDSDADTITISGEIGSDILPDIDNTYDLGSAAKKWAEVHATTFYGDGSQLTGLSSTLDEVTTNGDTTTNSITVGGLIVNSTGALELPVGTTAQRPASINGSIRFNSDLVAFEGYDGVEWGALGGGGATYSTTAPNTNLKEGDLWFDTGTTGELYVYSGTEWLSVTGSGGAGFYQRSFVGDNTTTAYNVYGVSSSVVLVYINGVLVTSPADYSYTNGIVTFVTAPALNDEINVLVYGAVSGLSFSSLGLNSTDDLTEGSTNLYYTDARVQNYLDTAGTLTETDTLATVTGRGASTTTNVEFNGTGNSVLVSDTLRIAQTGSGLRMTNVGAFDNDGSDNFRLFATNTLYLRANGETGGGIVIDDVNQNVTIDNDLIVSGNLTVNGTTTTINSTTLTVDDLNITLASGAADAAAANGAGITVDGAGAALTYNGTSDLWKFTKQLQIDPGYLTLGDTGGTDNSWINNLEDGNLEIVNQGRNADFGAVRINRFNSPSGDTTYFRDLDVYNGKNSLVFKVDGSAGNVGIGTDSPITTNGGYDGGTLHIHNAGTGSSIRLTNSTTGTGTSAGMLISKWSDSKTYFTNFDSGADMVFTPTNSGGSLVANTFVIKSDGNIGIGTSTVGSKLTVDGADEIAKFQNTSANTNVRMVSSDTGTNYITFQDTTASSGGIRYYHGNNSMTFKANDSDMVVLNSDGDWLPQTTTQDLGSTSNPWQNIYTQDMHLSNESRETGNEIDGTKGNWTIQEGAEDLYIINNKTGKRFRFKLEELD